MRINITPQQTIADNGSDIESKILYFADQHCLILPRFLTEAVLQQIDRLFRFDDFYDRADSGIAQESCLKKNPLFNFLHFLMNDQKLFNTVESLTACKKIRSFQGRVYQFVPGLEHFDSWHDDVGEKRLIGISINLSPQPYAGGYLEIKHSKDSDPSMRIKHRHRGDALLFRVSRDLKHRVTPVTGHNPRIVFAGWFLAGPKFRRLVS